MSSINDRILSSKTGINSLKGINFVNISPAQKLLKKLREDLETSGDKVLLVNANTGKLDIFITYIISKRKVIHFF